jgi:type VI secretion system protein ImpG
MREKFLDVYNRELGYLRNLGVEFGRKYPKVASRLALEKDRCDDPHVERIIEAFAFLAARIHLRIEDEFPEISAALLDTLYPHFLRPVPSMSIVQFLLDREQSSTTPAAIPRGQALVSRPGNGVRYEFRTCYDTTVWPFSVTQACWRTASGLPASPGNRNVVGAVQIRLSAFRDASFRELDLSSLRFHLSGDAGLTYPLYELLLSRCSGILLRDPRSRAENSYLPLPAASIQAAGFGEDEGMLPYPRRTFTGYQLLQDYFAFPEKFLFVDIGGLQELRAAGCDREAELILLIGAFDRADWRQIIEKKLSPDTLRLGCSPVVNLFSYTPGPVRLDGTRYEARIPVPPEIEIFSVDEVLAQSPDAPAPRALPRFFSSHPGKSAAGQAYWNVVRRPRIPDTNDESRPETVWDVDEEGPSDLYLSIVDGRGAAIDPQADSLTARLTCTNGSDPSRLPIGLSAERIGGNGEERLSDFQIEGGPKIDAVIGLHKPTRGFPAPSARRSLWHLISQLSLNHLSLVDEGHQGLQWVLRVHNFANSTFGDESIDAITRLRTQPYFARVSSPHGSAFVRGKRVDIELDEQRFAGSGAFLFASVLDRVLGLFTSMNSFSQLVMRLPQRGPNPVHVWPPRAGDKVIL